MCSHCQLEQVVRDLKAALAATARALALASDALTAALGRAERAEAENDRLRLVHAAAAEYRDAMQESIVVPGNPKRCERARAALFDAVAGVERASAEGR
jgi:hypothetical protein